MLGVAVDPFLPVLTYDPPPSAIKGYQVCMFPSRVMARLSSQYTPDSACRCSLSLGTPGRPTCSWRRTTKVRTTCATASRRRSTRATSIGSSSRCGSSAARQSSKWAIHPEDRREHRRYLHQSLRHRQPFEKHRRTAMNLPGGSGLEKALAATRAD